MKFEKDYYIYIQLMAEREKKRKKIHPINIEDYLDEGEKIQTMIRYDYPFIKRTKILGMTNTRSFMYWRARNKQRFVSSNRSFSHMEYGYWRMPIWTWLLLGISFLGPISLFFLGDADLFRLAVGMIIFPSLLTLICIRYRKFNYLGTAVGTEFVHIISRKGTFIGDMGEFLRKVHLEKPFGRPVTEKYIRSNYFKSRIRSFIVFFSIISLITTIVRIVDTLESWGI